MRSVVAGMRPGVKTLRTLLAETRLGQLDKPGAESPSLRGRIHRAGEDAASAVKLREGGGNERVVLIKEPRVRLEGDRLQPAFDRIRVEPGGTVEDCLLDRAEELRDGGQIVFGRCPLPHRRFRRVRSKVVHHRSRPT